MSYRLKNGCPRHPNDGCRIINNTINTTTMMRGNIGYDYHVMLECYTEVIFREVANVNDLVTSEPGPSWDLEGGEGSDWADATP